MAGYPLCCSSDAAHIPFRYLLFVISILFFEDTLAHYPAITGTLPPLCLCVFVCASACVHLCCLLLLSTFLYAFVYLYATC